MLAILAKVEVILRNGFWKRASDVSNGLDGMLWGCKERNAVLLFFCNRCGGWDSERASDCPRAFQPRSDRAAMWAEILSVQRQHPLCFQGLPDSDESTAEASLFCLSAGGSNSRLLLLPRTKELYNSCACGDRVLFLKTGVSSKGINLYLLAMLLAPLLGAQGTGC